MNACDSDLWWISMVLENKGIEKTCPSLQAVEVVDNDSNEQVEHKKCANDNENYKENISAKVTLIGWLLIHLKRRNKAKK